MIELSQTEDRLTLIELVKAGGTLSAYDLHRKYRFSPGQLYSAISKLQHLQLVQFDGSTIVLTDYGHRFSIGYAERIWARMDEQPWKTQLPNKYAQLPAPKEIYYCPPQFLREPKPPLFFDGA